MVESLYKNSRYSNSDSFGGIKDFMVKRIKDIFGYNLKDKGVIEEAIKNRKEGNVIVNYNEEGQKYILGINLQNKKLMFVTDNLPHHINIKHKYISDGLCLGGGRMTIDEKNKVIELYGKSRVYGNIKGVEKEAMINLLAKSYPAYKVFER